VCAALATHSRFVLLLLLLLLRRLLLLLLLMGSRMVLKALKKNRE